MSKFILILKHKRRGTLTNDLLQRHVAYLKKESAKGNIFLAGPFADNDGAMQIIEAESRSMAVSIVNRDPFVREQYYRAYDLHELIEANEENNWLMQDSVVTQIT